MQVHRNLTITGTRATLDQIVARMEALATGEWRRDRAREEEINYEGLEYRCFECTRQGGRPHARAWLVFQDGGARLWLANVTPCEDEGSHLGMSVCNAAVNSFYRDLVEPAAEGMGVEVELGPQRTDLSDRLSAEALTRLNRFVASAPKATGASHPSDRALWFAFLIAAHRDNSNLDAELLEEWLSDDAQFPSEIAAGLASEYELGRALLAAYDEAGHPR